MQVFKIVECISFTIRLKVGRVEEDTLFCFDSGIKGIVKNLIYT